MLTNDDGIHAAGIQLLALELSKKEGYKVTIVAPDQDRSGTSHSFSLFTPLRASRVTLRGLEDIESYAVNGTPTDCTKIGLCNLLDTKPDCIISGINHGQNLGVDTIYSGTVSAAMEGAILGTPSMAVSRIGRRDEDFGTAIQATIDLLPAFLQSRCLLWNVNVPPTNGGEPRGVRFVPLAHQVYGGSYIEREDPFGLKYYWPSMGATYECRPEEECDMLFAKDGYVTVTPLLSDFTDHEALMRLQRGER